MVQFRYLGCTEADDIRNRHYCFELIEKGSKELIEKGSKERRSGGEAGSNEDQHAPKVAKKTAQPQAGLADAQASPQLNTTTPSLHPSVPGWVQTGQRVQPLQLQQQLLQGSALPGPAGQFDTTTIFYFSELPYIRTFIQQDAAVERQQDRSQKEAMQLEPQQQQQQSPEQQLEQQKPQIQPQSQMQPSIPTQPKDASNTLASSVTDSLLNVAGLDSDLVAEYLDLFAFSFSDEQREVHGNMILRMAGGSKVDILQRALERAVQKYR